MVRLTGSRLGARLEAAGGAPCGPTAGELCERGQHEVATWLRLGLGYGEGEG